MSSSHPHPHSFIQPHNHNHNHNHRPNRIPSNSSASSSSSSSWHNHYSSATGMMGGAGGEPRFTSDMRDRQARGKDPYADDGGMQHHRAGGAHSSRHLKEPFPKTERRDWAETVLDNPELLLMHAQSSGDTLPATRLRFKRIMCGLEEDYGCMDPAEGADQLEVANALDMRGQYYGGAGSASGSQQPRFNGSSSRRGGASLRGGR